MRASRMMTLIAGLVLAAGSGVALAGEPVLISWFGSGDRFFVDPNDIRPVGGGILEYYVRGVHNPTVPGSSVTLNRVDCKSGLYYSYFRIWRYDASGRLVQDQSFRPNAIRLAANFRLYGVLKDACRDMVPEVSVSW